jgi:hypothetical protein
MEFAECKTHLFVLLWVAGGVVKVSDVFVPGGLPKYTYFPRTEIGLEGQVAVARDNLCKILTVTGATKSGKTVLTRRLFPSDQSVWLDGGLIHNLDEFWDLISDQLEVIIEQSESAIDRTDSEEGLDLSIEANVLVAKGGGKYGRKTAAGKTQSITQRTAVSAKAQVIRVLREKHTPVVIDDFHYISRELQGQITRILKPLVFEGVPIIYLAIPHRRFDAIKVEREMNGRVQNVLVPMWSIDELSGIAQLGFPLLNIDPDPIVSIRLAGEAQGSPHLMQEFCKQMCYQSGVMESSNVSRRVNASFPYEEIYKGVAHDLGRNIFDKLARGPRTRTDRKQRTLRNGKKADIYRVVLLALADLRPSVETIEYEPLRASIRSVLNDSLPQAHEVSRVLEHMARISSTDESSVPVIDYEKAERKLHVTDPFFAFFLRWGRHLIDA